MNFFKVFTTRLLFVFILRFLIYGMSLIPFCYVSVSYESTINKILLLIVTLLLAPILIIFLTGLTYYLTPKVVPGAYKIFSTPFIKWLLKDLIANIVTTSKFLNDIANRVDFIKIIYYRLLGVTNIKTMIIASDVLIMDPNKFTFGKNIFIGTSTLISGHFIKNRKLVLTMGEFGDNVQIGACCKIAQGVKIGKNSIIGFGVNIGVDCIIGENVIIHDATSLDEYSVIGDNTVVGKKCLIGRKTHIGKKCRVGHYSSVGSKLNIGEHADIPELSTIKTDM